LEQLFSLLLWLDFFIEFQFLFKVLSQSQNKTIAIALANEQIEIVRNIPYEDIIVSTFDIDTRAYPKYFSCLTYHYLTAEKANKNKLSASACF